MSRSCHSATFSNAVIAFARIVRASPQTRSHFSGFFLCGIADEPACPSANGSCASPTSVRCRCRISVAKRSSEAAIPASTAMKCACRSRCTTCVEIASMPSPSSLHTRSSTHGGTVACVPTAPEILPTAISAFASASRRWCRRISSTQLASFSPNVVGSAWIPCVRPMQTACLCLIACSSTASCSAARSSSSSAAASRICSADAVSHTSFVVSP